MTEGNHKSLLRTKGNEITYNQLEICIIAGFNDKQSIILPNYKVHHATHYETLKSGR